MVVAEALDRLSRDQEHVAALFKQLSFAGVRIVTLAEGEISELHVGLKGTMNSAATSIAIDDPEHAGIIARILGHKTLKTAEMHYVHAGALQASRVQNAIIMEIRSGAGNTKEEDGECAR